MSFFSKKEKQAPTAIATVSTFIICSDDNKDLSTFVNNISSFQNENKEVNFNTKQQTIDVTKIKQSTKTITGLNLNNYDIVIFYHCDSVIEQLLPIIRQNNHLFIIIYSNNANESAIFREKCFNMFCNMITKDISSIHKVYEIISNTKLNYINNKNDKNIIFYECPHTKCSVQHLTENDLWHHYPLYHIGTKNVVAVQCPICKQSCGRNETPFQVHLRNKHGLCKTHECESEYKKGVPSYVFALVVVRRKSDNKFLLVQEFARTGFWLPGGRVDPGETTETAALRECEEEAGVKIKLKGILKIEYKAFRFENKRFQHTPDRDYNRMRVIYYAEPDVEDDKKEMDVYKESDGSLLAKSIPDYESMGACWVHPEEVMEVKLRAYEPSRWIPYVADGGNIFPMELMECEQRNLVN